MRVLVVASSCRNAGKTSIIAGLARNMETRMEYIKPIGDRLFYRKKQLWDYDSATMKEILDLAERPEDMSIGFEHSKLRYMYDADGMRERLGQMISGDALTFVEGGSDLCYGASVNLDSISLAQHTRGRLVCVVSGNEDAVMDDIAFLHRRISMGDVNNAGVIINKVHDPQEFRDTYTTELEEWGISVLGVLPHHKELTELTVEYLSQVLFAKVVAGEDGMGKHVKNVFVGAMSADSALRNPLFAKKEKLIITSGDRSDMILAALESDTTCIVLTNNILPPANIVSKAADRNIPMLVVPTDTYQTAKKIDTTEPLLSPGDNDKMEILRKSVGENIDVKKLLEE